MAAAQPAQWKSKSEELGEHIKRFRIARDLDLKDVADRVGVRVGTVRDWENGDELPAPRDWARLKGMVAKGLFAYSDLWRAAIADRHTPQLALKAVEQEKGESVVAADPMAAGFVHAAPPPRPEDATSLGDAIRRARLIEGLSQEELGEMLGVVQNTISAWEVGRTTPVRDHLDRLAELIPALARWREETRDIPKPLGPLGMTFKSSGDPRAAVQIAIEQSDTERGMPRIPELKHDAWHTDLSAKPLERFEEEPPVPEEPVTLDQLSPHERLRELGTRHVEFMLEQARASKDVDDCNAALVAARSDLEAANRDLAECLAQMKATIEEITKG